MAAFDPNQLTFEQGLDLIRKAQEKNHLDTGRILTSRDKPVQAAVQALEVKDMLPGTTKYQLPIALSRAQMFISILEPNSAVPEHSHDEGAGVRYITAGSIEYNGQELNAGDWMYIPAGTRYSFKVGAFGASMFYCYECCCARAN